MEEGRAEKWLFRELGLLLTKWCPEQSWVGKLQQSNLAGTESVVRQ